ncbi:MAG: pilus assembly protein [Neomegalonema sp.]|nr:pilus assembly protein [Neomegalonema sp.]
MLGKFLQQRAGNTMVMFALFLTPMAGVAGGAIDYNRAQSMKQAAQAALDAGLLGSLAQSDADPVLIAQQLFEQTIAHEATITAQSSAFLQPTPNTIDGSATVTVETTFLKIMGIKEIPVTVQGAAMVEGGAPCIHVKDEARSQALLVNSGATIDAPDCTIEVASVANPAAILNAGSSVAVSKICIAGSQIIHNGGTYDGLTYPCPVGSDPYQSQIPANPLVGACDNSGTFDPPNDGSAISLAPGVHCNVTFNGSPRIVFEQGLHIIQGRMIVNSGATVEADQVSFFMADLNSEIRFNGPVSLDLRAPTTGTYTDILMFEPQAASGSVDYIFNGTDGSTIEGLIYLPNRNVTYNSTNRFASVRFGAVVNSLIINAVEWHFKPLAGASNVKIPRLSM